ncbi:hypothetical protein, partial [Bradyrhizobium canariense]|uniref:hypothetical protein n=1 Tax=Bradyrhizobium canariense TaxID=255045 RepID=UPI001AED01FB
LALVQWLVLRHELPDQHVLDHRIVASYAPIAPLVTMSCRLLLRRVASGGVLPRERFSPLTRFGREPMRGRFIQRAAEASNVIPEGLLCGDPWRT